MAWWVIGSCFSLSFCKTRAISSLSTSGSVNSKASSDLPEGLPTSISVPSAVVSALAQGTKALKKAQEGLSVDYVQKLMEENDEAQMQCEELNQLLNGHGVSDDDADILKELITLPLRTVPILVVGRVLVSLTPLR